MAKIAQKRLFTWKQIDAASDLDRLRLVLEALPDEEFVRFLEQRRDRGRDDYPIRPTWNALIAGIVFQHPNAAALLRELWRNAELRQMCGFEPDKGAAAVPSQDAFGRFLKLVCVHRERLLAIFHRLLDELAEVLPDLGRRTAGDSKAIPSFGRPVRDEEKKREADGRRDTDADWGAKTYKGRHKDGTLWEKVVKWFGYKLHLLVDSVHELPLAFHLTKASAGDAPELLPLVDQLAEHHPAVAERWEAPGAECAADKGYDSNENNAGLYDDHAPKGLGGSAAEHITPVIDKRTLWKDGEKTKPLVANRADHFVYDEDGRVYCVCPATSEQRDLLFVGFERDRGTLKYRCPAAACGLTCAGRQECERAADVGAFGRVIRVPLDLDRRIFTPIARPTAKWKKAYNRRSSIERVAPKG
ncbi:MAG: transposase, partial [Deltaproteobacteria bacterium]|nr:transposase [Deltaproteobacteria bacterium]